MPKASRWLWLFMLLGFISLGTLVLPAQAHPVPRDNYDRIIKVKLSKIGKNQLLVHVDYRLEIDEYTAYKDLLLNFSAKIDVTKYQNASEGFYQEFTKIFSQVVADNVTIQVDGRLLALRVKKHGHQLKDEKGQALGHLRCDFELTATVSLEAGLEHQISIQEDNWLLKTGKIDLAFDSRPDFPLQDVRQASEELKQKALIDLGQGDEKLLRQASARFQMPPEKTESHQPSNSNKTEPPPPENKEPESPHSSVTTSQETTLLELFRDSQYSIIFLLVLCAAIGAIHALTPGHGKTLVAAYLVGEQGTIFHALVLGLVTTITHTGIVVLVALGMIFVPEQFVKSTLQAVQLILGLTIAGIGLWLLLCRLSGRADHFHIGGGHHHHHHDHHHHGHHHLHHDHDYHHHHDHADPYHDEHGNAVMVSEKTKQVSWWRLAVLGMQGGIVPCWDAVAMLFLAVGMNLLWLALPMLLAFSAGLAGVLVAIGILVVYTKKFAQSRWGNSRLIKALPIMSACIVIALGLWLCYDSVHGNQMENPPRSQQNASR